MSKIFLKIETTACILAHTCAPNSKRSIYTGHRCLFGIEAVLSQVQNGEERVIAYASRTFKRSQRRYCTTRRELTLCNNFSTTFSSFSLGTKISDQN